jgi:hypothetical protein
MIGWATLDSGSGTSGWHVVAAADFDGNGGPDLIWRNASTGRVNVKLLLSALNGPSEESIYGIDFRT